MSTSSSRAKKLIELFSRLKPFNEVLVDVRSQNPQHIGASPAIPGQVSWSDESAEKRRQMLQEVTGVYPNHLALKAMPPEAEFFRGNIENYIGLTQVPTGIIGPLFINGTLAHGDFYVPLATTEGALVASYNRGAAATRACGGITSVCLTEGVQRAPIFKFNNLSEVGAFMFWTLDKMEAFKTVIAEHSRYAQLEDVRINMEGNQVVLIFDYTTGDAAGQNMVTICTHAVCNYIVENAPVKPLHWFVESNYAGDKKATAVSFSTVRGKKVTAEACITRQVVNDMLGTTPEAIATYWQSSTVATIQSGSIGAQGHYANGLTALFLATGQDVACVSEAYVGITRMEVNSDGNLYVSVTLPSLVVGTVGGGTRLPSQQECLRILGCEGPGSARKFAEICAATILAGELSIAAALASGKFAKAHKVYGRRK